MHLYITYFLFQVEVATNVRMILVKNEILVLINQPLRISIAKYDFANFKEFYIGGVTQELRDRYILIIYA